jgi:hypothetical protein
MNIKWLDELLIDKNTVHHDVIDEDDGLYVRKRVDFLLTKFYD